MRERVAGVRLSVASVRCTVSGFERLVSKNPLSEPIHKIGTKLSKEDLVLIKKRRQELASTGMKDWQIAKSIALEMGCSFHAVGNAIRRMCQKGELPQNLNRETKEKTLSERGCFHTTEVL